MPNAAARDAIEAEDVLIKHTRTKNAAVKQTSEIRKASPDDPKHPAWPKGTEGGRGGKFRPKDGSEAELTQEIKDRVRRRQLRINLIAALHIGSEVLANAIPGLVIAADVAMVNTFARTFSE